MQRERDIKLFSPKSKFSLNLVQISKMEYSFYYHRFSNLLVDGVDDFRYDFKEIINVLNSISDEDLIKDFNERKLIRNSTKSLSESINKLLNEGKY